MTPFECYLDYIAIKKHFTSEYNYDQYNGKTSATFVSFKERTDRMWFNKLSRHMIHMD